VTVFGSYISQPTRAVLWTCHLLKINVDFQKVDVGKGENTTREYLDLNPMAQFPVLKDGDYVLWESHAIMRYLCNKYSDGTTLYPSSPQERGKVDQWLDWKHGFLRAGGAGITRRRVMSKLMKDISHHSMRYDLVEIPEEREARLLLKSLTILETQLGKTRFITNSQSPTLADLALVCEFEQLFMLAADLEPPFGCDFSKYPLLSQWVSNMRLVDGHSTTHKDLSNAIKLVAKLRKQSKL